MTSDYEFIPHPSSLIPSYHPLAHVSVSLQVEPQGPMRGVDGSLDADARRHDDVRFAHRRIALRQEEAIAIERLAIQPAIDVERHAELARAAQQIVIALRLRPP